MQFIIIKSIESQNDSNWVSVDLSALKPCWPSGKKSFFSRCSTRVFLTTLSKTLTIWLVKATGLKVLKTPLLPPLWTGQIRTKRRLGGMQPWSREALQSKNRAWKSPFYKSSESRMVYHQPQELNQPSTWNELEFMILNISTRLIYTPTDPTHRKLFEGF